MRGRIFLPRTLLRSVGITAVAAIVGPAVPFVLPAGFAELAPTPVLGFGRFAATLGLIAQSPASTVADLAAIAVGPVAIAAVAVVVAGHVAAAVPSFGPLDHPPF